MEDRVDKEALQLADEFKNACNPFLREAARSFLAILESEGLMEEPQ
jgi:hypothetical protein